MKESCLNITGKFLLCVVFTLFFLPYISNCPDAEFNCNVA